MDGFGFDGIGDEEGVTKGRVATTNPMLVGSGGGEGEGVDESGGVRDSADGNANNDAPPSKPLSAFKAARSKHYARFFFLLFFFFLLACKMAFDSSCGVHWLVDNNPTRQLARDGS